MRFLAYGPSLPDELLVARDEGRVLFFCGAGVSRAEAGLPGFLGLAERVLKELRALPDSPARKLVDIATKLQQQPIAGVGGILAADRIFGLLERDFALCDIERAVGSALRPHCDANLSAHQILLDLSRSPGGQEQLVTTNFDLLFEAAAPKVPRWTPNQLPDLSRHERFHGIVHLHGMFDETYSKPVGGRLVLSSAEFGRAYLAEGWATSFIREAIKRYVIVFVGYTADDPPVQYLLEALTSSLDQPSRRLYAFQEGRDGDAKALWSQKGVNAIAYSPDNNHAALWQTLNAWSHRARDPERWRVQLMRRALRGPESMLPHERGQVVHLAATTDGARALAEAKNPIPATWLCVFDPACRYETPGLADIWNRESPQIDPFALYGLDSDPEPAKPKENEADKRRKQPPNVVDVLAPTPMDGHGANTAGFRGDQLSQLAHLPPRLVSLAIWFMRVCKQPSALWWAAGQPGLHLVVIRNVQFELDSRRSALSQAARTAWRYLLEAWRGPRHPNFMDAYAFKERITREGWTSSSLRDFALLSLPVLSVTRSYGAGPPIQKRNFRLREVVRLDLEYSCHELPFEFPDAVLPSVLSLLRHNLEEAVALEREVSPSGLSNIPPIEPDPNLPGSSSDRSFGINPHILEFAALFRRLAVLSPSEAMREFAAWRQDDALFARLRIWVAGLPNFLGSDDAGKILAAVSDLTFWGSRDQRDLLLALARRWKDLSLPIRRKLERRLCRGPPRWRHEDADRYRQRHAWFVLDRLSWLQAQGCVFNFDVSGVGATLRTAVPDWKETDGTRAADSMEGRGGIVRTDTSFAELDDVPLTELIAHALKAHRRDVGFQQEYDPFAGLCEKRPVRVLAALMRLKETSDDLQIAWTHFLRSGARLTDKPKLTALIARRLMTLPQAALRSIIIAASSWLENTAKRLYETDAEAVRALFDKLLDSVRREPDVAPHTEKVRDEERDWGSAAWGSVARHLTAVLLADSVLNDVPLNTSLPGNWTERANVLRALPGDQGRFCLVELAGYVSWLFERDPVWTDTMILAAIDQGGTDRDAALAGFFTNPAIVGQTLFARLKPMLIELATGEDRPRRRYEQSLAGFCIDAWLQKTDTGERWLSDEELRTVLVYCSIDMRAHILWHVDQWRNIDDKLALLKNVWPLQLAARSQVVTGRLCVIAFNDEVNFPMLVDAILPLVSPFNGGSLMLPLVQDKNSKLFERWPESVLTLLSVVLPMDASKWPYGTEAALQRLRKVAPTIARDPRFVDLRRRQSQSR